MALYTYSDFENAAKQLGHFDTLSKADIGLAKSNPDVGMSLLKYVNDYLLETNASKKKQLENSINQLRQTYGGYRITGGQLQLIAPTATNFNYVSPYADRIGALTEAIAGRQPFSFDAEKDPSAQAAKKSYMRESRRATEDAIASAAAMTGGIPSSYAVTAGTQAGDYHASQFADKVQALENAAYNRYLNEESLKKDELNSLLEREGNERNAAYTEHMNKLNASGYGTSYSNYNTSYNYGGVSGTSGTGSSSIFDVLPKPSTSETKPSETPKAETPTTPDTGSGNTAAQLPSTQAPNVSLPNNYYDPYYSGSAGSKVNTGSSVSNALPTPTVGEAKPSVPETPSTPIGDSTSEGNASASGNDVSSQLPSPKPSDTPISSTSGTTGTSKTETSSSFTTTLPLPHTDRSSLETPTVTVPATEQQINTEKYKHLHNNGVRVYDEIEYKKAKDQGRTPYSTYGEYLDSMMSFYTAK